MAGDLDQKSALEMEMEKDKSDKRTVDFSRLKMLIDLYFLMIKSDYVKVIEARGIANKIMLSHQNQCFLRDIHGKEFDGKKFLTPFLKAQDNFDKETDKFIKLIAEQAESL
jgi:hypothetical protein